MKRYQEFSSGNQGTPMYMGSHDTLDSAKKESENMVIDLDTMNVLEYFEGKGEWDVVDTLD